MPTVFALLPDHNPHWHKSTDGTLASGYKVFIYLAGTTTKATTYRDSDGLVQNTNPIVLDARGEPPHGIYVESGTYKWVLAPDTDTDPPTSPIDTRDDITPINDVSGATADEWTESGLAPTYVNGTQFTLSGDQTAEFHEGRRLRITDSGGADYGVITTSSYSSPNTTVTVSLDAGSIDSGISAVAYGILSADNSAVPHAKVDADGVTFTGDVVMESASMRLAIGADIASAATLPVNVDGNHFDVTGTTAITAFASKGVGSTVTLQFDDELVLTHHATDLVLPYGYNIGTRAGDVGVFQEYAAGDWRLISFSRPTLPTTVTSRAMSGEGVESDFTAIPAWVRSISIFLQDVSGTGAENLELQLGDSGGIKTSGYVGTFASVGTVIGNHSSAFALASTAAAGNVLTGPIRLEFAGPGAQGDVWAADWAISRTSTDNIYHGSGTFEFISLGERLESLRLQWDGSATFDAGRVLLRYDA